MDERQPPGQVCPCCLKTFRELMADAGIMARLMVATARRIPRRRRPHFSHLAAKGGRAKNQGRRRR